jgi:hypothetical protein
MRGSNGRPFSKFAFTPLDQPVLFPGDFSDDEHLGNRKNGSSLDLVSCNGKSGMRDEDEDKEDDRPEEDEEQGPKLSSQRGGKLASVSRGNRLSLSALKFTPLDQTMDSDDEDEDNSGSSPAEKNETMIGDPADICSSDKAKTTRPVTNRARHLPLELTPKSSPTPSTKTKNRHRFRGSSPTLAYGFGKKGYHPSNQPDCERS